MGNIVGIDKENKEGGDFEPDIEYSVDIRLDIAIDLDGGAKGQPQPKVVDSSPKVIDPANAPKEFYALMAQAQGFAVEDLIKMKNKYEGIIDAEENPPTEAEIDYVASVVSALGQCLTQTTPYVQEAIEQEPQKKDNDGNND